MIVLALYDVHGNPDALDAVLADLDREPDAVVVGGDMVPGAFSAAALDRIDTLGVPVHAIRGNGEREVAEALGTPEPPADDLVLTTSWRTALELGEERARPLAELPLTVELEGVLYCHATPRSDEEILTRRSPPDRWKAALEGVTAPVVVAGHTHQVDDRTIGGVRFVNAGSVGLPYEGDGAARWLWVVDGRPEPRTTAYDAAAAGRRMLDAGWPDDRSVPASLIDPVDPDVITGIFEERAAAG